MATRTSRSASTSTRKNSSRKNASSQGQGDRELYQGRTYREASRGDERGYDSSRSANYADYDEYDDRVNRDHDPRFREEGRRSMSSRGYNAQRDRQDYESPRGYGTGEHGYWSPSEEIDYRESESPRGNRMRGERDEESSRGYSVRRGRDFEDDDQDDSRFTPINIRNERDADEDLDDADYLPRRSRNMRQGFSDDRDMRMDREREESPRRGRSSSQGRNQYR